MRSLMAVILCLVSSLALAQELKLTGKGFVREAGGKDPIFAVRYEHLERDGQPVATTIIHSELDGRDTVREEVTFSKGKFSAYRMHHLQRKAEASVKVLGDKVEMIWTENGKTKTATEDAADNLVVGASVLAYMAAHVPELEAGKMLMVRMAVPEHQRTLDFKIKRGANNCIGNDATLCTVLEVDSIFLRPFVKNSWITFRKDSGRYVILGMETPAIPLKQVGKKFESFRARIDYPVSVN